jgi:hypothetical protein
MTTDLSPAEQALRDAALEYHRSPTRGKIAVTPTKPLSNQRDLSLAYSPGVAYACLAIEKDPKLAADYTSRANLVGVVTNGTAVLGLGDIGRWPATRDGGQGLPVQEIRQHQCVRYRAPSATGQAGEIIARSNQPWAHQLRISRRRNASTGRTGGMSRCSMTISTARPSHSAALLNGLE